MTSQRYGCSVRALYAASSPDYAGGLENEKPFKRLTPKQFRRLSQEEKLIYLDEAFTRSFYDPDPPFIDEPPERRPSDPK